MFKNRRVLLSSVAIVLTLIVSAIFVNFTLAKSGNVADDTVSTSASTGLTGYSNIDLAVINSNDTGLQATGDDKYRIVQILPASLSNYATADTALTAKVTAAGYSGKISSESDYANTSDLWKYVYDGEYFRYAVFDGYKTISDMDMAEGAVQLTTVTVSDINDMDTDDQEILSSADMIYICAMNYTDYITTDLSEDLYNWLDTYATTDRHPVVIDYDTLCVQDSASITGNNDTYRMGTLAYKLMTKTHTARYDNVLVTGPVLGEDGKYYTYFYSLYVEASDNIETTGMTSTTKTISDFILRAEELGYVDSNPYYNKWYEDDSFDTFANTKSTHGDSAYAKVIAGSTSGLTGSKTSWDFDNAKILVITNGESSKMYNELISGNSLSGHPAASDYSYDAASGIWKSVTTAANSTVTSSLYYTGNAGDYAYVPSGADIYRIESKNLIDAITSGTSFNYNNSSTGYMDVATKTIKATITVDDVSAMEGASVVLFAKNSDGVYEFLMKDGTTFVNADLSDPVENQVEDPVTGEMVSDGTYTYTVSFEKLNADYTDYKMFLFVGDGVSFSDPETGDFAWKVGTSISTNSYITNYNYYIVTKEEDGDVLPDGYEFTGDESEQFIIGSSAIFEDETFIDLSDASGIDGDAGTYFFSDANDVINYVNTLYNAYTSEISANAMAGTGKFNFTDFDFIFIEKGAYSDEIGNEVYNQMLSAVDQGVYVIVSDKAGDGIGSGGESTGKDKVVVVSPSAKAIADIINAGVYRDGADNKFRVLEIQPDYPIDVELAETLPASTYKSGWKTHSDGSIITGDYYTVPSDVSFGYAKEELPENAEYYDFDLTKAKIAYAIDGISYSQIELTQVSTEALIGMNEDIAATYDLIYIGGDISAMDRHPDNAFNSFSFSQSVGGSFAAMMPNFIMYTHTGSVANLQSVKPDRAKTSGSVMLATPYVGTTYYNTAYTIQNGNDLTSDKYEELLNYINSGMPVIVGDELTSVYENMTYSDDTHTALTEKQLLMGYWYNNGTLERKNYYLDPSSRIYDLIAAINAKSDSSNVLWGFDPDATQKIENTDQTYGNTLYTLRYASQGDKAVSYLTSNAETQSWYETENDVIKSYATVFTDTASEEINNLINQSSQRVRLTVTSKPTEYQFGIESSYISYTNLSYSFILNGRAGTYKYNLYVDKDKNTNFDASKDYYTSGTVKVTAANDDTETSVNLALDSDFFGAAYWLLEIEDSDGNVVAQQTGISKIVNTTDGMSEINVLQVQTMVDGQNATTWNVMDSLYFDIQSQTAHKICLYNTYANQGNLDNISAAQYACLGRHENRFGIVEYDTSAGGDDYFSNLADALTDDYDINLDIIVASPDYAKFTTGDKVSDTYDCLETWVSEAETLSSGGTVEGITQAGYKALVANALSDYNAKMAITESKKADLDNFLSLAIDYLNGKDTGTKYATAFTSNTQHSGFFIGFNGSMSNDDIKELLQWMMDTGEYYQIFFAGYTTNTDIQFANGEVTDTMFGPDFINLFKEYRDAKDAELEARDLYQKYLRRSYGADFMKKMYSILILGPSECFGGFLVDLNQTTCEYIVDYVSSGGDLFFFHDTMTPYADAGAVNLTKSLLDVVGMNRFHVDFTDQSKSYNAEDIPEYGLTYGTLTEEGYVYIQANSWEGTLDTTNMTFKPNGSSTVYDIEQIYYNWQNLYYYKVLSPAGTSGLINAVTSRITDLRYVSPDETLYYMTPIRFSDDLSWIGSINSGLKANGIGNSVSKDTKMYVSALSMTYLYQDGNQNGGTTTLPFIYASMGFMTDTAWSGSATQDQSASSQTVKASQLNEGLVTMYPFKIGASLNISGTHQQAYALDLETGDVKVWYTLAGANNSSGAKIRSSLYAADPYDAMENYFIYTTYYGSGAITYCGAGHSSVTGPTTRNNDERRLFINVIVNSAEAVVEKPSIKIYEPDGTYTTELDKDEEMTASTGRTVYYIEADSKTDTPEFDVKVTIPDGTSVTSVRFYYDGDYDGTGRPGYIDNSEHAEIYYEAFADGYTDAYWTKMMREAANMAALNLKEEYFSWYGGAYTYLVVEVYYDGATKPVYSIIKIKAADPLFDLTENNTPIEIASVDAAAEKEYTLG